MSLGSSIITPGSTQRMNVLELGRGWCRLFTIREYIEVRRQTIANSIVDRPIFKLCLDQESVRGTVPHLWWWEQSMDIDLLRVGGDDLAVVEKSDLDLEVFAAEEVDV